jgi:hypothetical protein
MSWLCVSRSRDLEIQASSHIEVGWEPIKVPLTLVTRTLKRGSTLVLLAIPYDWIDHHDSVLEHVCR